MPGLNFMRLQKHTIFFAVVCGRSCISYNFIYLPLFESAERKARYDKFGEEGLKGGVPTAENEFLEGYTFHGDAKKVFKNFFGGENPFAGIYANTTVL